MGYRLQDGCLFMCAWIRELQAIDESYKEFGPAFPRSWKDNISGQLFSLIYTDFGRNLSPRATDDKMGKLKAAFLKVLEGNTCRLNYQETINTLENILEVAVPKYGEQKATARIAKIRIEVAIWGDQFIPSMKTAGFSFKNIELLENLISLAQKKGQKELNRQNPDWMSELKLSVGVK